MKHFKIIRSILMLVIVFGFTSCAKDTTINVVIEWDNKSYVEDGTNYYVALGEGLFSTNDNMFEPIEQVSITAGEDETVSFSVSISVISNYTVFVYQDIDENGKYTDVEDLMNNFDLITVEAGEDQEITLTPYY